MLQSCLIDDAVVAVGKYILSHFSKQVIAIVLFILHISASCWLAKLGNPEVDNAIHFDRLGAVHAEAKQGCDQWLRRQDAVLQFMFKGFRRKKVAIFRLLVEFFFHKRVQTESQSSTFQGHRQVGLCGMCLILVLPGIYLMMKEKTFPTAYENNIRVQTKFLVYYS